MLLKAIDQARNTARGLYPGDLEDTSLMIALNELASHTSEGNCVFYCPKPVPIDDSNTATHLYRIAQEAVSNAVNHGKAKNIQIGLIQNKEEIILSIKDNGIGLSNAVQKSKGIGFKIMKYRAHMMNAIFQIAENKPHGVQLKCTLKKPKTNR
ncbi:MAG: hypothetical protein IPJ69_12785 [Deltaproteobacteria bacterium]|nr:MAG: hypothetical protein IPJ69_12785 [Deltaproteobacteria bacterium]